MLEPRAGRAAPAEAGTRASPLPGSMGSHPRRTAQKMVLPLPHPPDQGARAARRWARGREGAGREPPSLTLHATGRPGAAWAPREAKLNPRHPWCKHLPQTRAPVYAATQREPRVLLLGVNTSTLACPPGAPSCPEGLLPDPPEVTPPLRF